MATNPLFYSFKLVFATSIAPKLGRPIIIIKKNLSGMPYTFSETFRIKIHIPNLKNINKLNFKMKLDVY